MGTRVKLGEQVSLGRCTLEFGGVQGFASRAEPPKPDNKFGTMQLWNSGFREMCEAEVRQGGEEGRVKGRLAP